MSVPLPRRLIEVDLPIARISAHARREKSIRHGHISTLHIWWARRPLAACRAVICAALWPDPVDVTEDEVREAATNGKALQVNVCPPGFREAAHRLITAFARKVQGKGERIGTPGLRNTCSPESLGRWEVLASDETPLDLGTAAHQNILRYALLDFIADFANWDNSTVPEYLETARALTQAAHEALGGEPGTRPLVVDPFAGGGSIPLEALRVGADAFASDLNPVAVLLNKVVLEYIPKYGQKLADEVRKWGQWIKVQAEKELAEFYPKDTDGATPIAYLWARTIISEAPDQDCIPVEVPLIRSMWLVKKKERRLALRWVQDKGEIQTRTVEKTYADGVTRKVRQPLLEVFQPESTTESLKGTSTAGTATCPLTQFTTSVESVRAQVKRRSGGSADARLVGVVVLHPKTSGRIYRLPTSQDIEAAQNAAVALEERKRAHVGPLPFLPTGQLNHLRGFFNVVLYGMNEWGQLFSPRQALVLTTLLRLVRSLGNQLSNLEGGLRVAVQSCLALAVSRHADINASLGMWHTTRELITHVFGRQALPMVWDYAEANPFCDASGAFAGGVDWIARVLEQNAITPGQGQAEQASATKHPLPDHFADAVITDPPYYAAIPYADLSDFFYSWLRPSLRDVHAQLFASELTPKADECVQLSHRAAMYRNKDAEWFETMMTSACTQSCRITKPSGVSVFVFANKETSGWEAMLAALISAGWVITASWPIDTEMGNRLRARNSAVLASSVHLVLKQAKSSSPAGRTNQRP
jgi:putative DNA methylase